MSAILAIPLQAKNSIKFATLEKCAAYFKTTESAILECLEKGTILLATNGKQWVIDEAVETHGIVRIFRAEDGEEVRLRGTKAFLEWSGYKHADMLFQGKTIITNKNNGKVYRVYEED